MIKLSKAAGMVFLLAMGCGGDEELSVGQGGGLDARLSADVYTWDCASTSLNWMGVLGFDVAFEFVPNELDSRDLPPVGSCSYGIHMFATDALQAGQDIPGYSGNPTWSTVNQGGEMLKIIDGLWLDDVFKIELSCEDIPSIVTSGIELVEGGVFSSITTPEAGDITSITSGGSYLNGIPYGEVLDLEWEATGWDESFIQVRRERNNVAYEVVTCNTSGLSGFAVNEQIWQMFNEDEISDTNLLYVGFQNTDVFTTEYDQTIEVASRALHVVGIQEL